MSMRRCAQFYSSLPVESQFAETFRRKCEAFRTVTFAGAARTSYTIFWSAEVFRLFPLSIPCWIVVYDLFGALGSSRFMSSSEEYCRWDSREESCMLTFGQLAIEKSKWISSPPSAESPSSLLRENAITSMMSSDWGATLRSSHDGFTWGLHGSVPYFLAFLYALDTEKMLVCSENSGWSPFFSLITFGWQAPYPDDITGFVGIANFIITAIWVEECLGSALLDTGVQQLFDDKSMWQKDYGRKVSANELEWA